MNQFELFNGNTTPTKRARKNIPAGVYLLLYRYLGRKDSGRVARACKMANEEWKQFGEIATKVTIENNATMIERGQYTLFIKRSEGREKLRLNIQQKNNWLINILQYDDKLLLTSPMQKSWMDLSHLRIYLIGHEHDGNCNKICAGKWAPDTCNGQTIILNHYDPFSHYDTDILNVNTLEQAVNSLLRAKIVMGPEVAYYLQALVPYCLQKKWPRDPINLYISEMGVEMYQ